MSCTRRYARVTVGIAACTLATGLFAFAVTSATAVPPQQEATVTTMEGSKRPPREVTGLTPVDPQLGKISLRWDALPDNETFVARYEVYGTKDPNGAFGPDQLIGQTIYPHFTHYRLGPENQTWYYQVVVVDAGGKRSKPSPVVAAEAAQSAAINGEEVASIGQFDHKSLEFALSPNKSSRYLTQFPSDPDFTVGTDSPGVDWSYIHPGPADRWAGSAAHDSTMRFSLEDPRDLIYELWLLDTHKSSPGEAKLLVNGTMVKTITFEDGAMLGSTQGDATVDGSGLKPSYVQITLPQEVLQHGENVITLTKTSGSWHVYDAVGVFDLPAPETGAIP